MPGGAARNVTAGSNGCWPARTAAGAIGEVSLVDDQYTVAGGAQMLSRASAVDAGADNGDVELQAVKPGE
jgi:hypothetical protein